MARYIDADKLNGYEFGLISSKAQDLFHKTINDAPTEDVKPIVYGEWKIHKAYQGGIKEQWFQCSKCGWENALLIPRNFCPNCGATMKQKREPAK